KLNLLPELSSQFELDRQTNLRKRQHLLGSGNAARSSIRSTVGGFRRRSLSGIRNPVRGGHVYRNATDATAPPISGQFPSGKLAGNWAGSGFQRTRVSIDRATPN